MFCLNCINEPLGYRLADKKVTHTKEVVAFLAIDRGCRHGSPANFSIILSAIQSNTATNRLAQNDVFKDNSLKKCWLEFSEIALI